MRRSARCRATLRLGRCGGRSGGQSASDRVRVPEDRAFTDRSELWRILGVRREWSNR